MSTAGPFTWRSTSTDGFRKTRVTHRRPRPSHWSGRERIDGIRLEWEGQHGFIVLTRVRQTRKGLRTDGHHRDRPSVADADEHPPNAEPQRLASSQSSTRGSGRPTAGPGADTRRCPGGASRGATTRSPEGSGSAPALHSRMLADGPCRSPTPARDFPRARTSNVYSVPVSNSSTTIPLVDFTFQSVHSSSSVASAVYRVLIGLGRGHCIPDERAGVGRGGGIGGEARRGGRRTVQVIRQGARRADNFTLVPIHHVRRCP